MKKLTSRERFRNILVYFLCIDTLNESKQKISIDYNLFFFFFFINNGKSKNSQALRRIPSQSYFTPKYVTDGCPIKEFVATEHHAWYRKY